MTVREIRIWISYFDQSLSRKYGRRLPRELAVPEPKPSEVLKACESLGLRCEAEEKRYPRVWHRPSALITLRVPVGTSKHEVIRSIGRKLVEMRGGSK